MHRSVALGFTGARCVWRLSPPFHGRGCASLLLRRRPCPRHRRLRYCPRGCPWSAWRRAHAYPRCRPRRGSCGWRCSRCTGHRGAPRPGPRSSARCSVPPRSVCKGCSARRTVVESAPRTSCGTEHRGFNF